ncbi:hypothetical protein B0T13DRAFT_179881 [Neurospora crassa]|nr:hypothetical protein B0T13DRAFT_179881 [Neurospora crassa]
MLPRGLQLSQSFSRSCVRLPIARSATTPSIAFSTSATRRKERPDHNPDAQFDRGVRNGNANGTVTRQTSDERSRRVPITPRQARHLDQTVRPTTTNPEGRHEENATQARPLIRTVAFSPKQTRPLVQYYDVVHRKRNTNSQESEQQLRAIARTARSSLESDNVLKDRPELKARPAVRIIRHLARDPIEKTDKKPGLQAHPPVRKPRRLAKTPDEKRGEYELQVPPAARPVNWRKEDFLGERTADSRLDSVPAKKPTWATSPLEKPKRKRSSAEASGARKDTETGFEEVFPSQSELQAWFREFTSERSNFEAPAQSVPLELLQMRVKKSFEHDKVESEKEMRRLEGAGFSGPIKMDPRHGTVGPITLRQPRDEFDTLVSSVDMEEKLAVEQSDEDGGPAIIVLDCVSRSLLESDFRHIAGHGQHVDGWTYGLVKVVQSRSRTTHEPQGCYFLFFDNESNARAYINVLERLHNKSRQRLPKEWRQTTTATPTPVRPAGEPEGSEDVEESADELPDVDEQQGNGLGKRSEYAVATSIPDDDGLDATRYTLLPPTAPLHYQIFTRDNILEFENIREASKGLRPQQLLSQPKSKRSGAGSFISPPPKDLINYAQDPQIEHSRNSALVHLVGTKMTIRALRTAIEIDSEARNYPWQLLQEEEPAATPSTTTTTTRKTTEQQGKDEEDAAIKPILSTLSTIKFSKFNEYRIEHELDEFSGGQMDEGEMRGFSRFVVSFADVSEARRFVRTWHKREMLDPRTERMVLVNVTSLW